MADSIVSAEGALVEKLRCGDEIAFAVLVGELHGALLAHARTITSSSVLAEDVAQETWLAVIRGVHDFEGRSSLKTWIFSILTRRARTMAARELRHRGNGREGGPTAGIGTVGAPEESREAWGVLLSALAALPDAQRQVVLLRDVEGLPARSVCQMLGLSGTNQRVLLHRGRTRLKRALERYHRDEALQRPPSEPSHTDGEHDRDVADCPDHHRRTGDRHRRKG